MVWRDKIADYKAGYSYTAAPLIVNGLVITGNSGGEFGIVGEVQARDAETGEICLDPSGDRRPHGHAQRRRKHHDRHAERDLAGRYVENRRRRDLAGWFL